MAASQPTGMMNDSGLIITYGIFDGTQRSAIVLPFVTDSVFSADDKNLISQLFLEGLNAAVTGLLAACLSEGGAIVSSSAEAMIDGIIPARMTFAITDFPGTRTGQPASSQVAAEGYWYEDAADVPVGERVRIAKNFIPCVSGDDLVGDIVQDDLITAIQEFTDACQLGVTPASGGQIFYRILAAPKDRTPGTAIRRTFANGGRGYPVTQRRRLLPHL